MTPGEGAAFTALRMPMPGTPGAGPVHLLPAVAGDVRTQVVWRAWGHGIYLRPDYLFASHDGLYLFGPVVGVVAHHTVLPPIDPVPPGPLPPRAAGLVGAHRSARPGDGMELRDIRPFQPGDRLRRVDWRVSLRAAAASGGTTRAPAHCTSANATPRPTRTWCWHWTRALTWTARWASWNARPAVRTCGRAAASTWGCARRARLAATFLRHGDRVGLVDLGHPRGGVPVGSGRRQLQRIRHQLVHAARRVAGSGDPVLNQAQVPAGATVVVLSPFLDDKLVDAGGPADPPGPSRGGGGPAADGTDGGPDDTVGPGGGVGPACRTPGADPRTGGTRRGGAPVGHRRPDRRPPERPAKGPAMTPVMTLPRSTSGCREQAEGFATALKGA